MPSKKKKYNARFPPARIKKIMQMDEDVGKVAATVPVIISRALELFIESLIQQATQTTLSKNAKTLSTSHIKQTIESQERYKFLRELVASIPDHQVEEEAAAPVSSSNSNYNNGEEGAAAVKRPRGRPRKAKEDAASVPKRGRGKRKREESSESSESEDSEEMIIKEDSEETEDAEDESDEEANIAPRTSLSVSSSSAFGTYLTATAARNGSPKTVTACDGRQCSQATTTLTKPPPLSLLLGHQQPQPQHHHPLYQQQQQQEPLHHQQFLQQQQQYTAASSLPSPMMPAAMPGMYQCMAGMAPGHIYNWPGPSTSLPNMIPNDFLAMATPQSHYANMGGFSSPVGLSGVVYAGIPGAHLHGYPMQPVAGSGVGIYRGDVGSVDGGTFPGMPAKHSQSVSAHSEDRQAQDDYDT